MTNGQSSGLRFERAFSHNERLAFERALEAAGSRVTGWMSLPDIDRTFAVVTNAAAFPIPGAETPAAIDTPPLCILQIVPSDPVHLVRLYEAFAGNGRPAGTIETLSTETAVIVVWDDSLSPLSLMTDLAGLETRDRRRIIPLLPLSDRSLAQLGATLLGLREFDEARLIETHLAVYESKLR